MLKLCVFSIVEKENGKVIKGYMELSWLIWKWV